MGVTLDLPSQSCLAVGPAPSLGECQEEALLACQSVFDYIGLSFQGEQICVMCHEQPHQVCDIFTENLLAIDAKVRERTVAVKLRRQLCGGRVILGEVFRGPP